MGVLLKSTPLEIIKPNAPIKPIKTPKNLPLTAGTLKITTPKINVKNGVNELSIPAKELVILVSAKVNKSRNTAAKNTHYG